MEHAIGEIITLPDGRKVEVVEWDGQGGRCDKCIFLVRNEYRYGRNCSHPDTNWIVYCSKLLRRDHKNIIYKEVKDIDLSYEKYLQEKAQLEAYGQTSVITYEEWKQIKEE